MKLNNGAIPLAYIYDHDRQSGIVMAQWGQIEFIVWTIEPVLKESLEEMPDLFTCSNGYYWKTKRDAQRCFEQKVKGFYK